MQRGPGDCQTLIINNTIISEEIYNWAFPTDSRLYSMSISVVLLVYSFEFLNYSNTLMKGWMKNNETQKIYKSGRVIIGERSRHQHGAVALALKCNQKFMLPQFREWTIKNSSPAVE